MVQALLMPMDELIPGSYGLTLLLILLLMAALWLKSALRQLHQNYFAVWPLREIAKYSATDPERLRRYLERVLATPSPFDPSHKIHAYEELLTIYAFAGDHERIVEQTPAMLHCFFRLSDWEACGSLEAHIRWRYAESLTTIGQTDAAKSERRLIEQALRRGADDSLRHKIKGRMLVSVYRFAEACDEFQQALLRTPPEDVSARINGLVHAMVAGLEAGRPEDVLRISAELVSLGANRDELFEAYSYAGVAAETLNRLDDAEDYYRQAYDVARVAGNQFYQSRTLVHRAELLRKRGKLEEALEMCRKAAVIPQAQWSVNTIEARIYRKQGRFDEALASFARDKDSEKFGSVADIRRADAVAMLETAGMEAECGRGEAAWRHLQEACVVLKDDAKKSFVSDSMKARILAVSGRSEESRQLSAELETRVSQHTSDSGTLRFALLELGMAAQIRGDSQNGVALLTRCLDLNLEPVSQPTAYYFRGECYLQSSQQAEAVADFQAAVTLNLQTHHTELSRQRLAVLTGTDE